MPIVININFDMMNILIDGSGIVVIVLFKTFIICEIVRAFRLQCDAGHFIDRRLQL
jgi:hypothetical protein